MRLLLVSILALLLVPLLGGEVAAQDAPPRVEILEPREWRSGARGVAVVQRRSLRVIGSVDNPGRLDQIRLNGAPISFQEFPGGSVRFMGAMDVTPETRTATVEVRRTDGSSFEYEYGLRPALDDARAADPAERWDMATGEFRGQRWALVIGVSRYADREIPDLRFAAQDARAMAEFLRTPQAGLGGFSDANLLLMTDEEATFQNIRSALRGWLRQSTPDDVIYIFIAGHGLPDPRRAGDLYLLPYDARLDNLAATAIPMDDFQRDIDRLDSRATIVLADACHSAGIGVGGARALTSNPINSQFLDRMQVARGGLVTITSSQANQISWEEEAFGDGHGVFTYHLIQGLQGAADVNRDGIVDVGELFDYVHDAVRRATSNAQTPAISDRPFERAWPLAIVPAEGEVLAWERREPVGADVTASVFLGVYDESRRWHVPDSLVAVIGSEEEVAVRLGGPGGERLPAGMLEWRSSNAQVAAVGRDGLVRPLAPGVTTITVGAGSREAQIPVRVYPTPTQVRWTPREPAIDLVRGENVRVSVAVELPDARVVQGIMPQIEVADTLILGRGSDGLLRAVREGETTIRAKLGAESREWPVRVQPPLLRIRPPAGALLLGDTLELPAEYVRRDGSVIGEALGVSWESADPSIVSVGLHGLIPESVGRTTVSALAGSARDEFKITVLGDLLFTTHGADGRYHLRTLSLRSGQAATLYTSDRQIRAPSLSPDGSTIAFVGRHESRQPRIYLMDADGTNLRRLTPAVTGPLGLPVPFYQEHSPVWSHDGSKVFFTSNHSGSYRVYSVAADGSRRTTVTEGGALDRYVSTASDAPRLAFERVAGAFRSDVIVALETGAEPLNLTQERRATTDAGFGRPALLPGSLGIVMVQSTGARDGESLVRFDLATRQQLQQYVAPQRDHEIVYAASPAGDQIAYVVRRTQGRAPYALVIINLEGTVLQTHPFPASESLLDLSWAAVPSQRVVAGGGR